MPPRPINDYSTRLLKNGASRSNSPSQILKDSWSRSNSPNKLSTDKRKNGNSEQSIGITYLSSLEKLNVKLNVLCNTKAKLNEESTKVKKTTENLYKESIKNYNELDNKINRLQKEIASIERHIKRNNAVDVDQIKVSVVGVDRIIKGKLLKKLEQYYCSLIDDIIFNYNKNYKQMSDIMKKSNIDNLKNSFGEAKLVPNLELILLKFIKPFIKVYNFANAENDKISIANLEITENTFTFIFEFPCSAKNAHSLFNVLQNVIEMILYYSNKESAQVNEFYL